MMDNENSLEVREMALGRTSRKVAVTEFILEKVEELKNKSRMYTH
jgi:hypothetical protein